MQIPQQTYDELTWSLLSSLEFDENSLNWWSSTVELPKKREVIHYQHHLKRHSFTFMHNLFSNNFYKFQITNQFEIYNLNMVWFLSKCKYNSLWKGYILQETNLEKLFLLHKFPAKFYINTQN